MAVVPYSPVPYVKPEYVQDTKSLRDLMLMASQARQQALLQQGQLAGQGRMAIGALIANAIDSFQENRAKKAAFQLAQQKFQQEETDKAEDRRLRELQLNQPITAGPRLLSHTGEVLFEPPATPAKPEPGFALSPGQTRFDATGKQIAALPAEPKPEPREPNPTEASLALLAAKGDVGAKRALEIIQSQRPKPSDNEPLVAIMGTDNNPVLVPRSQAVGKRPANTREQGRPVTSGDAGKIADLDTGMQLLDQLRPKLAEKGATGIEAQIGAAVPNFVTQWTGWGADAKSRQATIDQVKQIIGKALEGGVLRKEDEIKYEKILPTIKDPPEVAASKLEGLNDTLAQKRQNQLDNLQDAGYEVGAFVKRGGVPRVKPAVSHAQGFSVVAPDGNTYSFKSQAALDAFKARAGIK